MIHSMARARFRSQEVTRAVENWAQRSLATSASRRKVKEAWVEVELDGWMVAYRLVAGDFGEPILAELRVFPLETNRDRPAGVWSAEVLGVKAKVPSGGLPADLLRHVSVTEPRRFGGEFSQWLEKNRKRRARKAAQRTERSSPKRGRPARSDRQLARVARAYVESATESRSPVADVASQLRLTPAQVRNILSRARRKGLLSPTQPGRSGGQLSDYARDLLAD